jgi:hypothetical protein
MIIDISDPADPAVVGQLFAADVLPEGLLSGAVVNLFFSSTGSDANDVLFDLSEPPSFSGPPMAWGRVNDAGDLELFLAPTTGDESHPLAVLHSFQSLSGAGELTRFNKLPDAVNWAAAP